MSIDRWMDKEVVVHIHNRIFSSVQFSSVTQLCPTLCDPMNQHARPPCPSPTPGVHRHPHPSSQWCHPAISLHSHRQMTCGIVLGCIQEKESWEVRFLISCLVFLYGFKLGIRKGNCLNPLLSNVTLLCLLTQQVLNILSYWKRGLGFRLKIRHEKHRVEIKFSKKTYLLIISLLKKSKTQKSFCSVSKDYCKEHWEA